MITVLPFDSDLFGYPVGKVLWNSESSEAEFCEAVRDFQLVYLFSEGPVFFESKQILHVDTKVTFLKKLENQKAPAENYTIEKVDRTKIDSELSLGLYFLALESGGFSRFKCDPRLQNEEFERLYRIWIEKAMSLGTILMAPNLAGMVTLDIKEDQAQIGLIAVNPEHRRKSWGRKLVLAAETEAILQGAKSMLIPTQEANLPAMKLYQDLGYQLLDRSYIYHFWNQP